MLFNSLSFILFFAIVLTLYYSPYISWNYKKGMLLFASYIFYGMWNPLLVLILWFSTIVDWLVGNRLFTSKNEKHRKLLLLISIIVNLGFLGFFKYGSFLLENFSNFMALVGVAYTPLKADIILPMGISFYTFQSMSYSIDLYKKRIEPGRTFTDFALYVTFFPQLVAGPIVRSGVLMPQFYSERRATANQFIWGCFLLTLGLFQKIVFADVVLADVADKVFGNPDLLHPLDSWVGTFAFSGQILFDFAGYSTAAIGIALMLGIVIPDNFKYPYASIGFSEFWQRWHISLSSWLRDYLYIPLGGNRSGTVRTFINLMVTMVLGGLWHGASWTFVLWGALHGGFLCIERFLRSMINLKITVWNGFLLALLTYMLVNITWVFFRADDFEKVMNMLTAMFFLSSSGSVILQELDIAKVLLLISGVFLCHWYMRNSSALDLAKKIPSWSLGLAWAVMIVLITIAQGTGQQFIYFQF